MLCPLCGCDFDETDHSCATDCPIASIQGCHLVCCPNCGYQMVDESKSGVARWLRRLLHQEPPRGAAPQDPGERRPPAADTRSAREPDA
jgi:hypothetical protein